VLADHNVGIAVVVELPLPIRALNAFRIVPSCLHRFLDRNLAQLHISQTV
jgi:hypothetical protein